VASEEPIIRDNVSDDEQQRDFHEHGEPSNQSEYSSYFKTISGGQLSEKIQSTRILIKGEGVLVQMTFTKG